MNIVLASQTASGPALVAAGMAALIKGCSQEIAQTCTRARAAIAVASHDASAHQTDQQIAPIQNAGRTAVAIHAGHVDGGRAFS